MADENFTEKHVLKGKATALAKAAEPLLLKVEIALAAIDEYEKENTPLPSLRTLRDQVEKFITIVDNLGLTPSLFCAEKDSIEGYMKDVFGVETEIGKAIDERVFSDFLFLRISNYDDLKRNYPTHSTQEKLDKAYGVDDKFLNDLTQAIEDRYPNEKDKLKAFKNELKEKMSAEFGKGRNWDFPTVVTKDISINMMLCEQLSELFEDIEYRKMIYSDDSESLTDDPIDGNGIINLLRSSLSKEGRHFLYESKVAYSNMDKIKFQKLADKCANAVAACNQLTSLATKEIIGKLSSEDHVCSIGNARRTANGQEVLEDVFDNMVNARKCGL